MLSKTCEYATRAMFYIAAQPERQYVPIREMAEALNISFHFLTKILQILNQNKLVVSFKGPNGGVGLARSAEEISLYEIVTAIDGTGLFEECLLGLDQCGDENPCPMHFKWSILREQLKETFIQTSLSEVADMVRNDEFRLTNLTAQTG